MGEKVGTILAALACLCVLSSCALTEKARVSNERLFADRRLSEMENEAQRQFGTLQDRTPYPVLTKKPDDLGDLAGTLMRSGDAAEIVRYARLMGDGRLMLRYAPESDTLLQAEGFLLSGNGGEALRLLGGKKDSPLYPYALLAVGDTVQTVGAIRALLAPHLKMKPGIRLALTRTLSRLLPRDRDILTALSREATNEAEKNYLSLKEEILFAEPDSATLRESVSLFLTMTIPGDARDELGTLLMPRLLASGLLVELYDVRRTLSREAGDAYPYAQLEWLTDEIETLRAYERADETTFPDTDTGGGSFRERYGDVARITNWGMSYALTSARAAPRPKPSPALYLQVKKRVLHLLEFP
ncbi:MAG: hypothetical protein MR609_06470 [Bacteroidales bacterium]|nr:hypothetical protein [Bacteroidales bacterium]